VFRLEFDNLPFPVCLGMEQKWPPVSGPTLHHLTTVRLPTKRWTTYQDIEIQYPT